MKNKMKVRRKFNLVRISVENPYETLDIELEAESIEEALKQIEEAWRLFCKWKSEGKIQ